MDIDTLVSRLRAEAHALQPRSEPPHIRPWPESETANPWAETVGLWAKHTVFGTSWWVLPKEDLISAAYWRFLGRHPDASGQRFATDWMNQGLSKTEWLLRLRLSPESLQRNGRSLTLRVASVFIRIESRLGRRLQRFSKAVLRKIDRFAERRGRASPELLWLEGQRASANRESERRKTQARLRAEAERAMARFMQAMETEFRGNAETVVEQMAADYGAEVRAAFGSTQGTCLDIGCGNGNWLAWLKAQGLHCRGVDSNERLIALAHARGLSAELADAIDWLSEQTTNSAAVITAFHLIEHLPLDKQLDLVAQAHRVLKPGGLLVIETPNPENLWVSTHNFYNDPTHRNPLTAPLLTALLKHAGFESTEVRRLHPFPDSAKLPGDDLVTLRLNGMTCCGQDLAALAYKSEPISALKD